MGQNWSNTGMNQVVGVSTPIVNIPSSGNSQNLLATYRVVDIILDDSSDRWNEFGQWNGIGTIFIEPIYNNNNYPTGLDKRQPAYPLFPNIKHYPLKNELVTVLQLANTGIETDLSQTANYYLPPINIWNNQIHNAIPDQKQQTEESDTINDYENAFLGSSTRQVTDNTTDINLGKTFKESNVLKNYPLLSYEGDIIYEGRFGNSIRLGSTVNNASNSNEWSLEGENGNPITIIKNGQGDGDVNVEESTSSWIPTLEKINQDKSSIYLTSNQKIPLFLASNIVDSYGSTSTAPNVQSYLNSQVILNAGQLVFNSKNDNIILSSNKSIHLSANTTLNFDAAKQITLAAPKVYLGSSFGSEGAQLQSVVLGEELNQALLTFTQAIEAAAEGMIYAVAIEGPISSVQSAGHLLKSACTNFKNTLNNKVILSNQVFVNKGK
jgi:hypothetical protein